MPLRLQIAAIDVAHFVIVDDKPPPAVGLLENAGIGEERIFERGEFGGWRTAHRPAKRKQ